jgi:hypothetical protein
MTMTLLLVSEEFHARYHFLEMVLSGISPSALVCHFQMHNYVNRLPFRFLRIDFTAD